MKPCFRFLFASVLALSSIQLGYAASKSGSRLSFSTVQLKTGVRLHYAQQGNKAGRPVILLHGYPDSWFSYSTVLPLLNAKYRVYVLDQRGHGNSERPVRNYSLPTFAADVIAFMDAMGIRRAAVVGHSMGSLIAQHVASMAPDAKADLKKVKMPTLVLWGDRETIFDRSHRMCCCRRYPMRFSKFIPRRVMHYIGKDQRSLPETVRISFSNDRLCDKNKGLHETGIITKSTAECSEKDCFGSPKVDLRNHRQIC